MVVDADTVETLRHNPRALIIDVRAPERYQGIAEPLDPRAGHIPGAVSAPYADAIDTNGRLLPADALRARYAALGADRAETIVCYCGSGVTAAHTILALERAGWKNVCSTKAPGATGRVILHVPQRPDRNPEAVKGEG
jgi:thiosulfate/3-mercaptopyruvate sulfurtransferase